MTLSEWTDDYVFGESKMSNCGNCGGDLNYHTETRTDNCLKQLSIKHEALKAQAERLRSMANKLVRDYVAD